MRPVVDARALAILGKFILSNEIRRVVLPANTCPVVFALCGSLGVETVPVDLSPNLSQPLLELPESRFTGGQGASALLLVRNYGFVDWTNECLLEKHAKELGFDVIIDDRCLCEPLFEGFWADLTLFSFSYAKFIEKDGGGAIGFINPGSKYDDVGWQFKEDEFTNIVAQLYGESDAYQVGTEQKSISWVANFDAQEKASFFRWIDRIDDYREQVRDHKFTLNEIYQRNLNDVSCVQLLDSGFHDWRFNLLCPNADVVLKELFANNLFGSNHYSVKDAAYPVCFNLSNRIINLFNNIAVDNVFAQKCCEVIRKSIQDFEERI